jgi:carbon catabolite-derepressing protein kinase
MLCVDPVKRITVAQIIQHPFFLTDLPKYLQPLPQTSAVVGQLSSLVAPPQRTNYELIEGLGIIEEDVVERLTDLLSDMTKEEVMLNLRSDDPNNTVKVSYMLLRDKGRLGKDCKLLSDSSGACILLSYYSVYLC